MSNHSTLCPRCQGLLGASALAVVDQECPRCGGVFLAPQNAAQVLGEQGFSPEFLAQLAQGLASQGLPCVACARRMQQLPLRGRNVDLCPGCGALWLDAGELGPLTGGKFANGALRPAPAALGPVAARHGLTETSIPGGSLLVTPPRLGTVAYGLMMGSMVPWGLLHSLRPALSPAALGAAAFLGALVGGFCALWRTQISVNAARTLLLVETGFPGFPLRRRQFHFREHPLHHIAVDASVEELREKNFNGPRYITYHRARLKLGDTEVLVARRQGDEQGVRNQARLLGQVLGIPIRDDHN